jgi:hypothetical protein
MRFSRTEFQVTIKALALFFPLGWFALAGPNALRMFLAGAIFALFELNRARLLPSLRHAWPVPLLVCLYAIGGWIAPSVEVDTHNFEANAAVSTACYGVTAGFCLAYWSRRYTRATLLAFLLFALVLTVAANVLIRTVGVENIVKVSESELVRENPDEEFVFMSIFKPTNVIIGIVPMTLFALAALPLLLLPRQGPYKVLLILTSIGAIYANLIVVTRTTIMATMLSFGCVLVLLTLRGSIKKRWIGVFLMTCCLSAVILATSSHFAGSFGRLTDRFSSLMDDGRIGLWRDGAKLVWDYPLGGGMVGLIEYPWAHNLFLDCGLTNGWIGMTSMLVLFGLFSCVVARVIQKTNVLEQPFGLVLVSLFVAGVLISLTEPPNSALVVVSYMVYSYCLGIEDAAAKRDLNRRAGVSFPPIRPKWGEVSKP